MENYRLWKNTRYRKTTKYIILVPSMYFYDRKNPIYIDNIVRDSADLYVYDIWEKYFMRGQQQKYLPYHYFMTKVGDDGIAIKGQPDYNYSWYVEDLVSAGIIEFTYINSIVVMLDWNFALRTYDRRMASQLVYKVLNPVLKENKLSPERIVFIDDILKDNWKDIMDTSNLDYELGISTYFNFDIINQYLSQYKNYN